MGVLVQPLWEAHLPQQLMEGFLRVETWGSQDLEVGYWLLTVLACVTDPPALPVASVRCISRSFGNSWFGLKTLPSVFGSGPPPWPALISATVQGAAYQTKKGSLFLSVCCSSTVSPLPVPAFLCFSGKFVSHQTVKCHWRRVENCLASCSSRCSLSLCSPGCRGALRSLKPG